MRYTTTDRKLNSLSLSRSHHNTHTLTFLYLSVEWMTEFGALQSKSLFDCFIHSVGWLRSFTQKYIERHLPSPLPSLFRLIIVFNIHSIDQFLVLVLMFRFDLVVLRFCLSTTTSSSLLSLSLLAVLSSMLLSTLFNNMLEYGALSKRYSTTFSLAQNISTIYLELHCVWRAKAKRPHNQQMKRNKPSINLIISKNILKIQNIRLLNNDR